jgi:hypothetical protein
MLYPTKITLSWKNYKAIPSMPPLVPASFVLALLPSLRPSFKLIKRLSMRQRPRQWRKINCYRYLLGQNPGKQTGKAVDADFFCQS